MVHAGGQKLLPVTVTINSPTITLQTMHSKKTDPYTFVLQKLHSVLHSVDSHSVHFTDNHIVSHSVVSHSATFVLKQISIL